MFGLTSTLNYYLYNSPTDMRMGFNGLCGLIRNRMQRNPLSGEVFIFINKRRDHMKLLHWEYGGFILYYKLELYSQQEKREISIYWMLLQIFRKVLLHDLIDHFQGQRLVMETTTPKNLFYSRYISMI